ncbi:MAG TPA: MerR family transcriptional regulator, partial [Vicinamibacterales bacterium]|nr:MerR family transcriptional regulator [Vicinamibacterales bacterium]
MSRADVAEPTPETPRRALLKSADVCEIIKVQPYVLRSWEKEFPDLGSTRTAGGPRFYRQADVERVQRLKQLVFGEGLTIAGARRRLEEERGTPPADELPFEDEPVSTSASTETR